MSEPLLQHPRHYALHALRAAPSLRHTAHTVHPPARSRKHHSREHAKVVSQHNRLQRTIFFVWARSGVCLMALPNAVKDLYKEAATQ